MIYMIYTIYIVICLRCILEHCNRAGHFRIMSGTVIFITNEKG